jgi:nanoRNase/pAp phosphatase (c-di-AMP/oligoRNAs hydrolase)
MMSDLSITAVSKEKAGLNDDSLIIIVDGCKYNRNVTDLVGREIAVIDHHQVDTPDDVDYVDIRPEYGSCSTIISEYYQELGIPFTRNTATALLIGLNIDTANMTRGVIYQDIKAFGELWNNADNDYVNRIMLNNLSVKDLPYYKKSIENLMTHKNFGFIFLDKGCPKNLMGIAGDFFLGLEELDFIVISAKDDRGVSISTRSELKKWNAAVILNKALSGIGQGGGHDNMAGGFVFDSGVSAEVLFNRFQKALFN